MTRTSFALPDLGDLKSSTTDLSGTNPRWSLPTATIPSLSAAFSRRRAIFGAVALAVAPVASLPALAASSVDPADARLVELADAYEALDREVNATHSTMLGYNGLIDRYGPIEEELADTAADTMTGVMAKARVMVFPSCSDCDGSGLGLSIADDLVRLFGGRANV